MTTATTADADGSARRDSDSLLTQLRNLKNAPLTQRGEAALRLGAMTIAEIRRLEDRLQRLEAGLQTVENRTARALEMAAKASQRAPG